MEEGGYFDDDGNKLNPHLLPKPQLCLSCVKDENPNQEILCNLQQLGDTENEEFICFAYQNKYIKK